MGYDSKDPNFVLFLSPQRSLVPLSYRWALCTANTSSVFVFLFVLVVLFLSFLLITAATRVVIWLPTYRAVNFFYVSTRTLLWLSISTELRVGWPNVSRCCGMMLSARFICHPVTFEHGVNLSYHLLLFRTQKEKYISFELWKQVQFDRDNGRQLD